ncbi:DUF4232 domain-containing protein [Streptomyces sp. NPDC059740]|uniref:DUF4232 domain-containing protein n=1 Tax=Streptomyces sp. NPDC059740 TaxID=3346926 RepID=UPI00365C7B1D
MALAAAGVLALALATTACAGGQSTGAQGDSSTTAASAPSGTPGGGSGRPPGGSSSAGSSTGSSSVGASTTSSSKATGHENAALGTRCSADDLSVTLGSSDVGAGQVHYTLTFHNKGAKSCTLQGFPGVSLIKRDGTTIGKPASREGSSHGAVTLAGGGTADVTLHTLNQGVKGDSCWAKPAYLKVYPPGSKESVTLGTSQPEVCGDSFTTTALAR